MRHVAVLDLGKTNAKVALVDLQTLTERRVVTRPNRALSGPPWPHFDTEGLWGFFLDGLAQMQASDGIDAISITTHGACAALLDRRGQLAAPVLDYECTGPDDLASEYDALRPDFAETGSARLPMGLNIGAQLHWQLRQDPDLLARIAHVVTWPQYWGHRLTGELASDVTSLGCHTDLWNPWKGGFSSLVARLGLEDRMATPRRPTEMLGTVLPDIAAATGLRPGTPVAVGIHDSNASLLPHLLSVPAPFSVVSTGTWVVSMAVGGASTPLDPTRDTLVNVNALGDPVPSARFMGGREHEIVMAGQAVTATEADAARVLDRGLLLFPSVQPGSGPFPRQEARWSSEARTPGETVVALGHYLALMTAECLRMIGAAGPVILEGPLARNAWYCAMLAAASGRPVHRSGSSTGTALGAALLLQPDFHRIEALPAPHPQPDARLADLGRRWRDALRGA
ncbi:FGGY-family carbohydrate kinase [Neotabrizicola shimadae]|uniref:FGGY-family carbohydrate kinase n=1 Tax=Neotabrizicola shimadae TaxID=2807096 RepID=A0A8G0ZWR5_9RHOB|nr:FGGY-family carbohydrate kinase [Neotabrizicola shimadae]QYZ70342.1 FGGY-family carbohydrate kinase [Neotabrizicola shimadae]